VNVERGLVFVTFVIFCEILIREAASLNSCNSLDSSNSLFCPFDFGPFEGYRWRFCQ
jgi:hypothetical protein